ncbi:MAG: methylmalonyl-CoA mutase family protein, partial [Aestuariivirgaceae bacterium]
MAKFPDFTKVGFERSAAAGTAAGASEWATPEGIAIKSQYGPGDVEGLDFLQTYPGAVPFLRGPYPTMYTT